MESVIKTCCILQEAPPSGTYPSQPSKLHLCNRPGTETLQHSETQSSLFPAPLSDEEVLFCKGVEDLYVKGCRCRRGVCHASADEPSAKSDKAEEKEDHQTDGGDEDEMEPLRDALERAKLKAGKSAFKREALEAEAQNIAELAVVALEGYAEAKKELDKCLKEKEEYLLERERLSSEMDSLKTQTSILQQAASEIVDAESHEGQEGAAEMPMYKTDSVAEEESLADDTALVKTNGKQRSKPKRTVESINAEVKDLLKTLVATQARYKEIGDQLRPIEAKIVRERDRVAECQSVARQAEGRVQAVMQAAQSAVTVELESQAVLKETETAFRNAMSEIDVLESQELDFEGAERIREEMCRHPSASMSDDCVFREQVLKENGLPATIGSGVNGMRGEAPDDVRTTSLVALPAKPSFVNTVLEFADQNRLLIAGGVVVLATALLLTLSPLGGKLLTKLTLSFQRLLTRPAEVLSVMLPESHGAEAGFIQTIWLLLASVVTVPLVCRLLPGATPVLGFLMAGALVGPHALGIIKNVEEVRHLAELGVVFLLFNIGLELSLERLRSMAKMVFGMGSTQVLVTTILVALVAGALAGLPGPGAIILGSGLALSSTAVAMQVLQERAESGSRHGRATFSILLLQDLAVVVVLMLIPLLSNKNSASGGLPVIMRALGVAAVKAVICITGIILGGRVLVRPIYNLVARLENKEIFAALTLLVVLGTSEITQLAGLSLALGAFLAGLLLAETEYVVQVESDIEPYKGLLMGLFFMTVGMEISVGLMISSWRTLCVQLMFLLVGKVAIMAAIGPLFGISRLTALRSGLMLAPGGEFAFVAFGEAAAQGVLPPELVTQLYLVVSLSMAVLPYLAIGGAKLGKIFEKGDMKAMQPNEVETGHLKDHIIIAGFGRVGQLIAQLLSERLIPFVAVDVISQRVQYGKSLDLPVYFGDAGSQQVLHSLGAGRAACIVVVLDSPGSNYRCVWTMKRNFPNVQTYVRAFDLDHARNLERAGANVVVPETLEPSLQLAASVLAQVRTPEEEIGNILDEFRRDHFAELQSLSQESGYSLGYGFSRDDEETEQAIASLDETDQENGEAKTETPPGFGGIVATP